MSHKILWFGGSMTIAAALLFLAADRGLAGGGPGGGHGGGGGGHGGGGGGSHGGGGYGGAAYRGGASYGGAAYRGGAYYGGAGYRGGAYYGGGYRGGYYGGYGRYGYYGGFGYPYGYFGGGLYLGLGFYPWGYGFASYGYPYYDVSPYYSNDQPYPYAGTGPNPNPNGPLYFPLNQFGSAETLPPPSTGDATAHVTVVVPADAQLWFENTQTTKQGTMREFVSPQLAPGREFTYHLRASWQEGGHTFQQTRQVDVRAGARVKVDFTNPFNR